MYLEVLAEPDAVAGADWTVGACVGAVTDADVELDFGGSVGGIVVDVGGFC